MKRIGLVGKTLKHSFSKDIHSYLGSYEYSLIELDEEEFDNFLLSKDFEAINVTIPYKEKVIKYLDFVSEEVNYIKACNLVINRDGKLYGYNTDAYGLERGILSIGGVKDKICLILGSGGTYKTASYVLKKNGAKKVYGVSRSHKEGFITYEELDSIKGEVQFIVNATPLGMYPNIGDSPISLDGFLALEGLYDVVYNPLRTKLVLDALSRGVKAASGLDMLVYQAYEASKKMNRNETDEVEKIISTLRNKKENIVLIGMPSSGKSTLGKLVADKLDRRFIDIDEEIRKSIPMTIRDYILTYGEEEFRKRESEIVKEVAKYNSCVISTGGGVIKKEENMTYLKMNGKIIFIDRELDDLTPTSSRPLSSSRDDLVKLYEERYPLYIRYSDRVVKNDDSLEKVTERIIKAYED